MHLFIWVRISQPQSPLSVIPILLESPGTPAQGRSICYYLQGYFSAASCWGSALESTLLSWTLCSREVENALTAILFADGHHGPAGHSSLPPVHISAQWSGNTHSLHDLPCHHPQPKAFPSFPTPFRAFAQNFTQGSFRSSMLAYSNM